MANKQNSPSNLDLVNMLSSTPQNKPAGAKTETRSKEKPAAETPAKTYEPLKLSTFQLEKSKYDKMQEVALRNGMSFRQLFSIVISSFIKSYEEKHGEIIPRESKKSVDQLI